MVVDRLLVPDCTENPDGGLTEDGRLIGHALRRFGRGPRGGSLDGPSTVTFDPKLPMIPLDLSHVAENAAHTSVLMTCASGWTESAVMDPTGGQRRVVYDEAGRLMSHPALLPLMDALAAGAALRDREQADLPQAHWASPTSATEVPRCALASSLLANVETRIVHRQESDQLGSTSAALGLTGTKESLNPSLGTGHGLWRIKNRSFVVQHQMHPAELELFDTTHG